MSEPAEYPVYKEEFTRIETFPEKFEFQYAKASLAKQGFIFIEFTVVCFHCGFQIKAKKDVNMKLEEEHATKSPECPMVTMRNSLNVPMLHKNIYKREQDRLYSFYASNFTWPINVKELAKNGFYYDQAKNLSCCYYCTLQIGSWTVGDTAASEHGKYNPNCGFYTQIECIENVPLGEENTPKGRKIIKSDSTEDKSRQQLNNQGHSFIFHDLEHAEIAKKLDQTVRQTYLFSSEVHQVTDMCAVLSRVQAQPELFSGFGTVLVAIYSRFLVNSNCHILVDVGNYFRNSIDVLSGFPFPQERITCLIMDCEFVKCDQNLDIVEKAAFGERQSAAGVEFHAKGAVEVENLMNNVPIIINEELDKQTNNEAQKDQNNAMPSSQRINGYIKLKNMMKIEVPLKFHYSNQEGVQTTKNIGVPKIAEKMLEEGQKCFLLTGPFGSGKTVACRQCARYMTTHCLQHRVIYIENDNLQTKLAGSVNNFLVFQELAQENGISDVELRKLCKDAKIIIIIEGLSVILKAHKNKVLRFLSDLRAVELVLLLEIDPSDEEIISNLYPEITVHHLQVNPLDLQEQAKILSARFLVSEEEIISKLKSSTSNVPYSKPLYLQMLQAPETLDSIGSEFEFWKSNAKLQIQDDATFSWLLRNSYIETTDKNYHLNYTLMEKHGIDVNMANFLFTYNFMPHFDLLDSPGGATIDVEKLFSQQYAAHMQFFLDKMMADGGRIDGLQNAIRRSSCVDDFLINALKGGHKSLVAMCNSLIDEYYKTPPSNDRTRRNHSLLCYALKLSESTAMYILNNQPGVVELTQDDYPAHIAACSGFADVVNFFAENYPSKLKELDNNGFALLHYLTMNDHTDLVKTVLSKEFARELNIPARCGTMAIQIAARNCNKELFQLILLITPKDNRDVQIASAVCSALQSFNERQTEFLEMLLPLVACKPGRYSIREQIERAIILSVENGNEKAYYHLESKVTGVATIFDSRRRSLLHLAAKLNNPKLFLHLVAKLPNEVGKKDADGKTPLHIAAEFGRVSIVVTLISLNTGLCARDASGCTPLHLALMAGSVECARLLITLNSVNAINLDGDAPLHIAARNGLESVQDLVEFGADMNVPNSESKTPLECAINAGNIRAASFMASKNPVTLVESYSQIASGFTTISGKELPVEEIFTDDECEILPSSSASGFNLAGYAAFKQLKHLNMEVALHRYLTFRYITGNLGEHQKILLAECGFYLTSGKKTIQCFCCTLKIDLSSIDLNWRKGDVKRWHSQKCGTILNKKCSFLFNEKNYIVLNVLGGMDYTFEAKRLLSFLQDTWPYDHISVDDLAKNGFFHNGRDQNFQCAFCSLESDGWKRGDSAEVEHKRLSPSCPLLRNPALNKPIGQELNKREASSSLTKVVNGTGLGSLQNAPSLKNSTIEEPKHLEYSDVVDREKSFVSTSPRLLARNSKILADAGFSYSGIGSRVICFKCGLALDVLRSTRPYWEHLSRSESCTYIKSQLPFPQRTELIAE